MIAYYLLPNSTVLALCNQEKKDVIWFKDIPYR